jgi:imidazolonepropionase-like amidohydrolase
VDALIKEGVRVAIGTDYNAGSSTFNSQPMMMTFAMTYGKMSLEDAFKGVTRNAALSLGRKETGIIEESAKADLLVWNLQELAQIPYYHYNATQFITHRVKKGKLVNLKADKKKVVVEKKTTPESPKQ